MVRVVVFDIGGVLVRICRSWLQASERAGVEVRHPEWVMSELALERRRDVFLSYQDGRLSTPEYYRAMSEALEGRATPDEVRRVHDAWLLDEYPGVLEVVRDLHQRALRTACLSNTNEAHWVRLAPGNTRGEYPACASLGLGIASNELGVSKPDPRIYALAEALLGARGDQLVFFDDLAENVEAARAAGWNAWRVDPEGDVGAELRQRLADCGVW